MKAKFVQLSKIHQDMAATPKEATEAFAMSCNICCTRGINMTCERCEVKAYHDLVMAVFDDLKEYEEMKKSSKKIQ